MTRSVIHAHRRPITAEGRGQRVQLRLHARLHARNMYVQLILATMPQRIDCQTHCVASHGMPDCVCQNLARLPGRLKVVRRIHAQQVRIFDTGQGPKRNQQKVSAAFAIGQYGITLRSPVRHELQARRRVPVLSPVRQTLLLDDAT